MINDSSQFAKIEYEHIDSNAVLTPHLIHKNFFKSSKFLHCCVYTSIVKPVPVSDEVKFQRKVWCLNQAKVLASIPSNAILVGEA